MITSKQNSLIKEIRSLSEKKYRDKLGMYIAEGVKSVNEAIVTGQDIFCVVCTGEVLPRLNLGSVRVEEVSEEVFESVSGEVTPQGALAVICKPKINAVPKGSCLFLDGVSDPSNVGAIIRTAVASGYDDIYLANSADPFNGKAVRASMGGLFRANLIIGDREKLCNAISLPVIIADMDGEDVFKTKIQGDFCLVVGNEANGVSEFMKNRATRTVKIPMQNQMESLNVAVSAGILMYALKNNG